MRIKHAIPALAAVALLATPMTASATTDVRAAAPLAAGGVFAANSGQAKSGKMVAGPSRAKKAAARAAGLAEPPPYTCYWSAEWSWPAGNPAPVTYASFIECGETLPGPPSSFTLKSELHASPGGLLESSAPEVSGWLDGKPESRATSAPLARPSSHYVSQESTILNMPDASGEVDIWYELPAGCVGVGTPLAVCDMNYPAFNM